MNGAKLLDSYRSSGSETAFAEWVQRYTTMVYSVAKRRVSDQSLAEEVTQTVFIRLAKSPPKLTHDGHSGGQRIPMRRGASNGTLPQPIQPCSGLDWMDMR